MLLRPPAAGVERYYRTACRVHWSRVEAAATMTITVTAKVKGARTEEDFTFTEQVEFERFLLWVQRNGKTIRVLAISAR